jgi:hypothetical protein
MKISRKIVFTIGAIVAVPLVAFLVFDVYRSTGKQGSSVPFTILNDTNEAVEVIGCAGGGPQPPIDPGRADTYYTYPGSSYASCGFNEVKTGRYLGCLPTPVTRGKKDTFRVSNADLAIDDNDCGLNSTR